MKTIKFRTSGIIVYANDLRDYFGDHLKYRDNFEDMKVYAEAKLPMLFGCVGNSCPKVYGNETEIEIGNHETALPKIGHINTNIGYYSVCDFGVLLQTKQAKKEGLSMELIGRWYHIAQVKAGAWELIHHIGVNAPPFDNTKYEFEDLFPNIPYASLKWIHD